MIHLRNLTKIYPPNIVGLKDVSLHIKPGEFVCIVGRSGTGKSTLAKCLFAEERPSKGTIEIGGWDISKIASGDVPLLRRQIGVVFQDFKLLPKKTAEENVAFALQVAGKNRRGLKKWCLMFCGSSDLKEKGSAIRINFPAASSSAFRSLGLWCTAPRFCWPMSRLVI